MSHKEKPYYQLIGVLHGSSDRCRKETAVSAPGLYARVEQSEIHDFIIKTKKGKLEKKSLNSCLIGFFLAKYSLDLASRQSQHWFFRSFAR